MSYTAFIQNDNDRACVFPLSLFSYDKEYIIQSCMPKAYMEYISSDAFLFFCVAHQRYCLSIENNTLSIVESLSVFVCQGILFFVLPSKYISLYTVQDVFVSIFYLLLSVCQDFVFSISHHILFSFFLYILDFCNTKSYIVHVAYVSLNLNNSRIDRGLNRSFAYPVIFGGVE